MGVRLLLVDDSGLQRRVLSHALESHGLELERVREASSAPQALQQLRGEPIDLVLCNAELQGMSGFDFARAARRTHPGPIVLLAGTVDSEAERSAESVGASALLARTSDGADLVATLESVLVR